MKQPVNASEETPSLRGAMRDLLTLSTLPALWKDLGPDRFTSRIAEVLLGAPSLDLIYLRLEASDGKGVVECVRRKHGSDELSVEVARAAFAPLVAAEPAGPSVTITDPFGSGPLHVTAVRFGDSDGQGVLVGGSRNPAFPTEWDRTFLVVAANQVACAFLRRRAEQRMQEEREWLRVTLASIGEAVIATDTQGRVTFLNAVAEEITGWASALAEGKPLAAVYTVLDEATRRPIESPVEKVWREGVVTGPARQGVLVARDGTERPIADSAAPIRDNSGKLIGVVLVFRDVTERRKAERQVLASEARKSAILETALDCIITMDHLGKVMDFNPAAERTFGYSLNEVRGRELAELIIPPSLRERHRRGMARYLATGEASVLGKRIELPGLHATGREFPVELAITRISTDGPPVFTAYLRDISERTRAEQYRNARLAVTHALNQASDVRSGTSGILQGVCESLGWDVGVCWIVNKSGDRLAYLQSWHKPELSVSDFEAASCSRTFSKGEGLPGSVWSTGKSRWLVDVAQDANFPRAASAAKSGLHSAFACPVVVGDRVVGVIEFFTRRMLEPDAELLEMMGTVAGTVGQFIERRWAEQELRQSEAELADFFENATVGLHWVGADGIILRANRAELDMLGYSREEFIGRPIADFHVDAEVIGGVLHRLRGGEKLKDFPARLRCKDGSIKDVLIDSSGLFVDGGLVHTRCFTRDITEKKLAEEQLRESERKLRLLSDTIPQLAWMAKPDGDIFWYNRRWYEYTGTTPAQMEGWGWQAVHDPSVLPKVLERWRGSLASGEPFDMVFPLKGADGRFRPFLTRVNPLRDEHGQIVYWFGTNTDISEQKQAEQTARFVAEVSAALVELTDPISTLQKVARLSVPAFSDWCAVDLVEPGDKSRRVALVHADPLRLRAYQELIERYPPRTDDPHSFLHVLRTGEPDLLTDIPDSFLAQVAHSEEHLRLLRAMGLKSHMLVPIRSRGGTFGVLTFIAADSGRRYTRDDLRVARDLAHRAAVAIENAGLNEALREADRRKNEFLATLAHELRNPLAPLRNGLEIMRLMGDNAAAVGEARSMMERQLSQMVRLVDDLLDVSRISLGKLELRPERVHLATVVNNAVETSRPVIDAAGHELTVVLPSAPVVVDADVTRLGQVFANLLNNAAKYSERGGHIRLAAEREGSEVVVSVSDTGIGIPSDMLSKVFDLFTQVDRSLEKSHGGLGIGLTLVKRLVELHGGRVEAQSAGPGQGSTFTVRLPAVHEEPRLRRANPAEANVKTGLRVLVVDDNRDSAISLAKILRLKGSVTDIAHDGEEAVALAERLKPDVVLMDIGLPKLSGHKACRRIREQPWGRRMVLIALSGWGREEDFRESKEAGFDHHMVKPVVLGTLLKLLVDLPPTRA